MEKLPKEALSIYPNYILKLSKELEIDAKYRNTFCTICQRRIKFEKYLCIVCKNTTLCIECEQYHIHPTIKIKSPNFADMSIIFNYMHHTGITKKKDKEIKLLLHISSSISQFTMRPKGLIKLYINIENQSKIKTPKSNINKNDNNEENSLYNIYNSEVYIYSKNNPGITIVSQRLPSLKYKESKDIEIEVASGSIFSIYDLEVQFHSNKSNVKVEHNELKFKVIVNNDQDEEELNCYFYKYPKLLVESKETKEDIRCIIDQHITEEHPYMYLNYLKENNFDMEQVVYNLIKNNKNKFITEEKKDNKDEDKCMNFIYENF